MIYANDKRAKSCVAFQEELVTSCPRPTCDGCEYYVPWSSATGRPRIHTDDAQRKRIKRGLSVRCLTCGQVRKTCACKVARLLKKYVMTKKEARELLSLAASERKQALATWQRQPSLKRGRPKLYKNPAARQREYRRRQREQKIRSRQRQEADA